MLINLCEHDLIIEDNIVYNLDNLKSDFFFFTIKSFEGILRFYYIIF